MAFTHSWVETDPDGAVIFVSQLDDSIRTTKGALRERLEGDPAIPDLTGLIESGSFAGAPKPRKGTARVYVDTQANILAFGVTKREDGRMAVASDTKRLYHVATAAVVEIAYVSKVAGGTIVHDNVGDPGLGVVMVDSSKWAFAVQNDDYDADANQGLRFRVTAGGDGTISAPDNGSSPGALQFHTDSTARWEIDSGGHLVNLGNAKSLVAGGPTLALNAVDGFLYVPIMNGAPNGTPTAFNGKALVWDVVNERLYIYGISAWSFVQFS